MSFKIKCDKCGYETDIKEVLDEKGEIDIVWFSDKINITCYECCNSVSNK